MWTRGVRSRWRPTDLLLAGMVGLLLACPAAASSVPPQSEAVGAEMTLSPSGPAVDELVLTVPAGEQAGTVDFFVRQSGDTPLEGVTASTAGEGVEVVVSPASGAGAFTVPAAGGVVPLTARVEDLTQPVDSRVQVFVLTSAGQPMTLGTLRVVREDAPKLTLVGSSSDGLSFEQDREAFSRQLRLRSDSAADVRAVVTFERLQDDSSRQVPLQVELDGQPLASGDVVEVAARRSRLLTLRAELPRASTYRADLAFAYGSASATLLEVPVTITRTATTQTLVADDVEPARVTRGPCLLPWSCAATLQTSVSFRETGGQQTGFDQLDVRGVVLEEDGQSLQVRHGQPTLTLSPDDAAVTAVPVPPRGSVVVEATVPGVHRAGTYEIDLRGSTLGADPVDVTVKVLVRDSIVVAAALILLGSVLSALLRWWIGGARDHLGARVRVDALRTRHGEVTGRWDPSGTPRAVADGVGRMIARLAVEARLRGADPAVTTAVTDLQVRVELLDQWLDAADAAYQSGTPPNEPVETELRKASDVLLRREALDDDARAVFDTALEQARALLDSSVAQHREQELGRILGQAEPPLFFTDQQEWDQWREQRQHTLVAAQGGPNARLATVDRVYGTVVADLTRRLTEYLRDQEVIAVHRGRNELSRELRDLVGRGQAAQAEIAAGRTDAAVTTYEQLLTDYEPVRRELDAAGLSMSGPGQAGPMQLQPGPEPAQFTPTPAASDPANTPARRKAILWLGDSSAGVIVALVTVLLGLLVLYLPDPAWGSDMDWLTAFLWGLGLYQVGGAASQGLQGNWLTFRQKQAAGA